MLSRCSEARTLIRLAPASVAETYERPFCGRGVFALLPTLLQSTLCTDTAIVSSFEAYSNNMSLP
jgi:hypothetical protein